MLTLKKLWQKVTSGSPSEEVSLLKPSHYGPVSDEWHPPPPQRILVRTIPNGPFKGRVYEVLSNGRLGRRLK